MRLSFLPLALIRSLLLTAVLLGACRPEPSGRNGGASHPVDAEKPRTRLIYDTIRPDYTGFVAPSFNEMDLIEFPAGMRAECRRMPQFIYWKRRLADMARWKRKYRAVPLPENAGILETKTFATGRGRRSLLAWMPDPQISVDCSSTNEYDCSTVATGKGYFTGDLHFSLLDEELRLVNTVAVHSEYYSWQRNDTVFYEMTGKSLSYPFSVANPKKQWHPGGLYYFVRGGTKTTDGSAEVLHLVDFNADGKAHEFFLFDKMGCAATSSTLIGYDEATDRLKWYEWDLQVLASGSRGQDTLHREQTAWMDHVLEFRFDKQGRLRFEMDYRGRSGPYLRYELRYDRERDAYGGFLDRREVPEDSSYHPSLLPQAR